MSNECVSEPNIYYLRVWGGFFNEEFKKIHNREPGHYWFATSEERDAFLEELRGEHKRLNAAPLVSHRESGLWTRTQHIAKMTFVYQGNEYPIEVTHDYGRETRYIEWDYRENNYGCDCNRSELIREKYPNFPELDCGFLIEMKNFYFVDGETTKNNFEPEDRQ